MSELPGRFSTNSHPDYELGKELGRGAFGVVFEALQRNSKRAVALKIMLSRGASDPVQVSRFMREGQALARLDHPGIAKVYSFDSEDGNYWMAMELIHGEELSSVVKARVRLGKEFSIEQGMRWFQDLAEILDYCHEVQVAHRDLKPSNIIVEEGTNRLVLVDFGLLKSTDPMMTGQSQLTETGALIGTPAYMSPEQIDRSFGEMSNEVDIWALGATMFFCATGAPPFVGKSIPALCIKIMTSKAPVLTLGKTAEERNYSALVAKCLVKESKLRPLPQDLLKELHDFEQEERPQSMQNFLPFLLVFFVIAIGALSWTYGSGETNVKDLSYKARQVEIKGQVTHSRGRIEVNGRKVQVAENGSFSFHFESTETLEKISINLRYLDDHDCQALLQKSVSSAPDSVVTDDGADWRIHNTFAPRITGTVSDDAELMINSKVVKVVKGYFEHKIIRGPKKSNVTLSDKFGATVTRSIECIFPETFVARTKILENLRDWKKSDSRSQDIALAIILGKLGEKWRFKGSRTWTCGGQEYHIGTFVHFKSNIEFQLIPGGSFLMGSTDREIQYYLDSVKDLKRKNTDEGGEFYWTPYDAEQPRHRVKIRPFLIAAFETSNSEWARISSNFNTYNSKPFVFGTHKNIKKRLKLEKITLRLPSEAEWEYACRAGTRTPYFWGKQIDKKYLWYSENVEGRQPQSTQSHKDYRNAFGLADMSGNAWEICDDYYWRDYSAASGDGLARSKVDPGKRWYRNREGELEEGNLVVLRGGGSGSFPGACRSARRYHKLETAHGKNFGFRLARSLPKID